jgi:rRNA maturation RNase YbeY
MTVLVSSRLRGRRVRLPVVRSLAARVLKAAGAFRRSLSLLLVGDRAMRTLNRRYRRKGRTTDVLAFPMAADLRLTPHASLLTPNLLGDVVISIPQAARQARRAGHSLDREIAALMIHGTLHLLGYDHERSAREARRMQRKERMILRAIGHVPKMTKK